VTLALIEIRISHHKAYSEQLRLIACQIPKGDGTVETDVGGKTARCKIVCEEGSAMAGGQKDIGCNESAGTDWKNLTCRR
ncbi:MAG: hypothetical protein ABR557_14820, partial [Pyrinomonadaceae bacterium]